MIRGIGIDMIEVERVAAKIGKNSGFRELVFSADEIEYCERMTFPGEHYAARFAAKEAFFKALGTGWKTGTAFNEVEVVHDADSKPSLKLTGETAVALAEIARYRITVSLSHIKSVATAIVIIET